MRFTISPRPFTRLCCLSQVDQTCWQNSAAVQAWMQANGLSTTDEVRMLCSRSAALAGVRMAKCSLSVPVGHRYRLRGSSRYRARLRTVFTVFFLHSQPRAHYPLPPAFASPPDSFCPLASGL